MTSLSLPAPSAPTLTPTPSSSISATSTATTTDATTFAAVDERVQYILSGRVQRLAEFVRPTTSISLQTIRDCDRRDAVHGQGENRRRMHVLHLSGDLRESRLSAQLSAHVRAFHCTANIRLSLPLSLIIIYHYRCCTVSAVRVSCSGKRTKNQWKTSNCRTQRTSIRQHMHLADVST